MKEYVFLRINDKFRNFFSNDNINAFLELYNRRKESVFYSEQFRFFLEKNRQKEIIQYLKNKLSSRDEMSIINNKLTLINNYYSTTETLELNDNFLILNGEVKNSVFIKYLCEYDSEFLMIDINKNKIERISLVN